MLLKWQSCFTHHCFLVCIYLISYIVFTDIFSNHCFYWCRSCFSLLKHINLWDNFPTLLLYQFQWRAWILNYCCCHLELLLLYAFNKWSYSIQQNNFIKNIGLISGHIVSVYCKHSTDDNTLLYQWKGLQRRASACQQEEYLHDLAMNHLCSL